MGPRGRDGLNGPQGLQGEKGGRGLDAPPPLAAPKGHQGLPGNFLALKKSETNLLNFYSKKKGQKGEQGPRGEPGLIGLQGIDELTLKIIAIKLCLI